MASDFDGDIDQDAVMLNKAIDLLDRGDLDSLSKLVTDFPVLLTHRIAVGDGGYFANAALLHHIAGNPIRSPLPHNIVEIAEMLLIKGADPNAICGVPGNTSSTIGLLLTSKQASEAGVVVALIDLLVATGADDSELVAPKVLLTPLWNGGRATAEALADRGSPIGFAEAAGLGRIDILESIMKSSDILQLDLEEALVFACVQNEEKAIHWLIERGAVGDVNCSPGVRSSALHNIAWRGNTEIVKLLLAHGAHTDVRDEHWNGTPIDWAVHGGHPELAKLLRES